MRRKVEAFKRSQPHPGAGGPTLLARLLFAILAATGGLTEDGLACEPHMVLGSGASGTLYLTAGLGVYEESNGMPGLQRGCPGDPLVMADKLVA